MNEEFETISHPPEQHGENYFPKKLLCDHLKEVGLSAAQAVASIPSNQSLAPFAFIAGASHDFAKYTHFFQAYIQPENVVLQRWRSDGYKEHAFLSSLYAAYQVLRLLGEEADKERQISALLVFLAVRHHHGNLATLDDDLGISVPDSIEELNDELPGLSRRLQIAKRQVEDLREREAVLGEELDAVFVVGRPFGITIDGGVQAFLAGEWFEVFKRLASLKRWFVKQRIVGNLDEGAVSFSRLLSLFSALIDCDKRNAARLSELERPFLPVDMVDRYEEERGFTASEKEIDQLRNELYQKICKRADLAPDDQGLFTLTAPTGSGKTLAAFSAALRLREKKARKYREPGRIIYCLPYTTIVDQNYSVMREVFRQLSDFKGNEQRYLIKHHHLAELAQKVNGEELPVEQALMLTESWDSEMVVTTYVQLFDTLLGYRNANLKKLNRLANSIVLLDEVQSLPAEYWSLIHRTLQLFANTLGIIFILMTATQPELFSKEEAFELAGEPDEVSKRFDSFQRIEMRVNMEPTTLEQLATQFEEAYHPELSYLFIFNTIRSSLDFMQLLYNHSSFQSDRLVYLSSNVVPAERYRRVRKISTMTRSGLSKPPIIVSTQVVEAGVDLDVDVVIRDIGPIDSIVQAAGRCNRNAGPSKRGQVYVVNLVPEEGSRVDGAYCKMVYGAVHRDTAVELLRTYDQCTLPESALRECVQAYFQALSSRIATGK
ncbi:MAG: CRISPR-associated helicase Cas3', partial [Firmicutes bacterium]|nr:CRISPR-associated helicase Cas3' [Bacillota bacterium]